MKTSADQPLLEALRDLFLKAAGGLPGVEQRRMFGCDAFFRDKTIFGLIWKTGRIGVKLPEPGAFAALKALPGVAPWTAGNRTMAHWLLVPESFHDHPGDLRPWVAQAHRLAAAPAGGDAPAPRKRPRPRAAAAKPRRAARRKST